MSKTKKIGVFALFASISGCGMVHGTDGRTTTVVGFGRVTEGQTQMEVGMGHGMNENLSQPRSNTFNDRSPAAREVFGGGDQ